MKRDSACSRSSTRTAAMTGATSNTPTSPPATTIFRTSRGCSGSASACRSCRRRGLARLRAARAGARAGETSPARRRELGVLDRLPFRFVTELFLYTFLLCRENGVRVGRDNGGACARCSNTCARTCAPTGARRSSATPTAAVASRSTRRGRARLPPRRRRGALQRAAFQSHGRRARRTLLAHGRRWASGLRPNRDGRRGVSHSELFKHAGSCVLREGDLYLLLNASGAARRGAHAHNDALSIEVSACGVSFIADPGTYVYTGDARARHEFRSTEYHSTVEVDGAEQNTIHESTPFIIGDEARPHLRTLSRRMRTTRRSRSITATSVCRQGAVLLPPQSPSTGTSASGSSRTF